MRHYSSISQLENQAWSQAIDFKWHSSGWENLFTQKYQPKNQIILSANNLTINKNRQVSYYPLYLVAQMYTALQQQEVLG